MPKLWIFSAIMPSLSYKFKLCQFMKICQSYANIFQVFPSYAKIMKFCPSYAKAFNFYQVMPKVSNCFCLLFIILCPFGTRESIRRKVMPNLWGFAKLVPKFSQSHLVMLNYADFLSLA
jgi:hypothetical protein